MTTDTKTTPRPDGRPSMFRGKSGRPTTVALTNDAKAILADTAARLRISRSDVVEALIRTHGRTLATAVTVDGRVA